VTVTSRAKTIIKTVYSILVRWTRSSAGADKPTRRT